MVIDDIDVLELSISTEYLLQILLRGVETQSKHSQNITGIGVELGRGDRREKGEGRDQRENRHRQSKWNRTMDTMDKGYFSYEGCLTMKDIYTKEKFSVPTASITWRVHTE